MPDPTFIQSRKSGHKLTPDALFAAALKKAKTRRRNVVDKSHRKGAKTSWTTKFFHVSL